MADDDGEVINRRLRMMQLRLVEKLPSPFAERSFAPGVRAILGVDEIFARRGTGVLVVRDACFK